MVEGLLCGGRFLLWRSRQGVGKVGMLMCVCGGDMEDHGDDIVQL